MRLPRSVSPDLRAYSVAPCPLSGEAPPHTGLDSVPTAGPLLLRMWTAVALVSPCLDRSNKGNLQKHGRPAAAV